MNNNYKISKIQESREVSALFFNKLQKAYRKNKIEKIQPNEKIKEGFEEVTYEYNSLGYRSDEFIKNHTKRHVLFVGCSETEGCGGNLEDLWCYMLYKKINNEGFGFYNLGRAGWGWELIISNTMEYIREYGKPDNIFILFPNIGRFLSWFGTKDDVDIFRQEMCFPDSTKEVDFDNQIYKGKLTIKEQRDILLKFTLVMKIFEEYCFSQNIKLIWSTWDKSDSHNYKTLNIFKNFIELQDQYDYINNNQNFFMNNIESKKNWLRKRDGHQGYLNHFIWSEDFYRHFTNFQT